MKFLNNLRNEIAEIDEMENKFLIITHTIHTTYYKLFPDDNRAIDRTRSDYPLYLLLGIINNELWK